MIDFEAVVDDCRSGLFNTPLAHGQVAQLVEQRTENPRVGGSIPSLATKSAVSITAPILLRTSGIYKLGKMASVYFEVPNSAVGVTDSAAPAIGSTNQLSTTDTPVAAPIAPPYAAN